MPINNSLRLIQLIFKFQCVLKIIKRCDKFPQNFNFRYLYKIFEELIITIYYEKPYMKLIRLFIENTFFRFLF